MRSRSFSARAFVLLTSFTLLLFSVTPEVAQAVAATPDSAAATATPDSIMVGQEEYVPLDFTNCSSATILIVDAAGNTNGDIVELVCSGMNIELVDGTITDGLFETAEYGTFLLRSMGSFSGRFYALPEQAARLKAAIYAPGGAVAPEMTEAPTPTPTRTPVPTQTRPPATTPSPTRTATRTPSPTETPVASSDATASSAGAVEAWTEPISGMEFVHVPAGEFTMGSSEAQVDAALEMCNASRGNCERALFEDETPQHQVTLGDYWIGQTEVTNAQFHAFVEGGGYDDRSLWTEAGWQWRTDIGVTQPYCWDNPDWNQPDHPVVCVSWYEAVAYTRWLTREAGREFRLPTEAEWEKAARGTDGRVWPWGETPPDGSRANICDANCEEAWKEESIDDSFALTAPVGSFPQGASPYGALDMAGNVWEWTGSLYQPYPYDAADGREDLEAEGGRTLRGGGFGDFDDYVRCAFRGYFNPDLRGYAVGFRVMSPGAAGREEDAAAAPILAPTRTSTPTRTPVPTLTRPPATTPSPTETPVASSDATASSAGAVETWIEPISGMEFVHVPAGEFTMGSTDEQVFQTWTVCAAIHWSCDKAFFEGEAPQHSVLVDDYWIGLTEVTNAQFRPFVEGGGYADQSLWTGVGWRWRTGNGVTQPGYWNDAKWNQPDHPVVGVSWFEAAAYTRWLTRESGQEFRLPTEAEWEKACRGTDGRTYPWGDEPPDADRANFDDDAGSTTAVGSYPAGAGPYGALDMAGNVWEWTGSLDQPYPYDAADGREDPEATSNRTLRGGAFYGNVAFVRCAYRLDDNPVDVDYGIGFRVLSPGF